MSDKCIKLPTAKLADLKGFDLDCDKSYTKMINPLKSKKYLAPKQSVLQEWLITNHKIFATVSIPYDIYGQYSGEVWGEDSNGNKKLLIDGMTVFDDYFNAMEEALQEGLLKIGYER